jgi:uncharacterized repeat protein (TIGR01451 family)
VGNYAYVADWNAGLAVLDVSDPRSPRLVTRYNTAGSANSLKVVRQYAYVAVWEGGLEIIDVSDPADPFTVGHYDTGGRATGVHVVGNRAYVADLETGLQVIDVSRPDHPAGLGGYDTGTASNVRVVGQRAYVADLDEGLVILDVSNPASPGHIGSYRIRGYAHTAHAAGNLAYLADGIASLQVIDVQSPDNPQRVGSAIANGNALDVQTVGAYAYVADWDYGLRVFNVLNPANPTPVASIFVAGHAWGLHVVGGYAYLATGEAGLQVIDVRNPEQPSWVGSLDTSGFARGVRVAGHYALVADGYAGLQVIDVSNPASPVRVGGLDTPGYANQVEVTGSYALVADDYRGLLVIDLSNPASPIAVGGFDTGQPIQDIHRAGRYAYVASSLAGLWVLDVANPVNPQPVAWQGTIDSANAVHVDGGRVYVTVGSGGLQLFDTLLPTPAFVWREAESGSLRSPMTLAPDPLAYGGQYVFTTVRDAGTNTVDFYAPASGSYVVWCRVLAPNPDQDSFGVSVDGGPEDVYDAAETSHSSKWQWTRVNGRGGTGVPLTLDPRVFNLSVGPHSLVIRGRESLTFLDRLLITSDLDFVPADPFHTLTVNSVNPGSGVFVSINQFDTNGLAGGSTPFRGAYADNSALNVSAPASSGPGTIFQHWLRDGVVWSSNAVVSVTLDNDYSLTAVFANTNINPGLVGYWALDDGNGLTAADRSTAGNHGTLVNGPLWTNGICQGGLSFDGVNDYVTVADQDSLEFAGRSWTIALRVKTSRTSAQCLMEKEHTSFGGVFLAALNRDNAVPGALSVFTGSGWIDSNYRAVTDGQWHHLAVTFDGAAFRLYHNGVLDRTQSGSGSYQTTSGPLNLGRFATAGVGWYYQGQMDEVRRYNRALSGAEVAGLTNCPSCALPLLVREPPSRTVVADAEVCLEVVAESELPATYQWRYNSSVIAGATGSTLKLTNVALVQGGTYRVVVSNACGAITSAPAVVTVVPATNENFLIVNLSTNGALAIEHASLTGDDRGGIAASASQVFYSGDSATARFSLADLSGSASLGVRYDALVSNLKTERVYTLAHGTNPIDNEFIFNGNTTADALIELDGNTGALTTNRIVFSAPISLASDSHVGLFSGYNRLVVHSGQRVHDIALPSGSVNDLGFMPTPVHAGTETWAYWGVAEYVEGAIHLVYVRDSRLIVRTRVPDGVTTGAGAFESLSDMAAFTVSVPRQRWYFHHEGTSQFRSGDETLGLAEATLAVGVQSADVSITAVPSPGPSSVTAHLTHVFTITNHGPATVAGVVFQDRLPSTFQLVSATTATGCTVSDNAVVCPLGSMPGGAAVTVTVVSRPLQPGWWTNTAQLLATDTNSANNTARVATFVNEQPQSFTSTNRLTIPTAGINGIATPYPATLSVSGLSGGIASVTLRLNSFSHNYPDDVDMLLVSPSGRATLLMSDAGGGSAVTNLTLIFDDTAATALEDSSALRPGIFQPTDHEVGGDNFPAPAPPGPYPGSLSVFQGDDPNGTWALYVFDDYAGADGGALDGWTLTVTATSNPGPVQALVDAAAPGETLLLPAGTYLDNVRIDKTLTLQGGAAVATVVDGHGAGPVFIIGTNVSVSLVNLTLRNGRNCAGSGAGLQNFGELRLTNCVVVSNQACVMGGGIFNRGALTLDHSVVSFNSARDSAAGILNEGSLVLVSSLVASNTARPATSSGGRGGGIFNSAFATLEASAVMENYCRALIDGPILPYLVGEGGGIYTSGQMVLRGSTVANNTGYLGGGIANDGTLILTNCTVSGNRGHGVRNFGTLSIHTSRVLNNSTDAINYDFGGGIENFGTGMVLNCLIGGNSAGDDLYFGRGGGIANLAFDARVASLFVSNTTLSANSAEGDGYGGGIYNTREITLANCTVTANRGFQGGGAWSAGTTRLRSSLIGGNFSPAGSGADVLGPFDSLGFNFIQDTNPAVITNLTAQNIYGLDPLLGPLQNNGGPTLTHALLPGSPAIDRGHCSGLTADQRGVTRPHDVPALANAADGCDIGAYEFVNAPPTIAITNPPTGAIFAEGAPVTIQAEADDVDGVIDHVEFVVDGINRGSDADSPFGLVITNLAEGSRAVSAIAVDNLGARATSMVVSVTVVKLMRWHHVELATNGQVRLWLAFEDASPIPSARLPRVEILISTNVTAPPDTWTRWPGTMMLTNGLILLEENSSTPQRFYISREVP